MPVLSHKQGFILPLPHFSAGKKSRCRLDPTNLHIFDTLRATVHSIFMVYSKKYSGSNLTRVLIDFKRRRTVLWQLTTMPSLLLEATGVQRPPTCVIDKGCNTCEEFSWAAMIGVEVSGRGVAALWSIVDEVVDGSTVGAIMSQKEACGWDFRSVYMALLERLLIL
jgi:hypothetical protein